LEKSKNAFLECKYRLLLQICPLSSKAGNKSYVRRHYSIVKYLVQLSEAERHDLQRLIGLPLRHIQNNGWDVTAQVGDFLVTFTPNEVPTPDATHPNGDAVRPSIKLQPTVMDPGLPDFGVISFIRISSTFLTLSQPAQCPPFQLSTGPSGTVVGYGPVFLSPTEAAQIADASYDHAVVHLDVAISFHTDIGRSAFFFTDGVGFFVHVACDTEPLCEWSSFVTHHELHSYNA